MKQLLFSNPFISSGWSKTSSELEGKLTMVPFYVNTSHRQTLSGTNVLCTRSYQAEVRSTLNEVDYKNRNRFN